MKNKIVNEGSLVLFKQPGQPSDSSPVLAISIDGKLITTGIETIQVVGDKIVIFQKSNLTALIPAVTVKNTPENRKALGLEDVWPDEEQKPDDWMKPTEGNPLADKTDFYKAESIMVANFGQKGIKESRNNLIWKLVLANKVSRKLFWVIFEAFLLKVNNPDFTVADFFKASGIIQAPSGQFGQPK